MLTTTLLFIAAVFLVGGIVKGVIGLGLQVLPMVLLVLVMSPLEAAALLVVPGLVANIWQIVNGPPPWPMIRRLWPMLLAICLGTWLGGVLDIGMMGPQAAATMLMLAATIIAYAALGLLKWRFSVPSGAERWAGPLAGLGNGVVTAATGVFVVPAVPYLAALDATKDELVQGLGLVFLTATIALAVNLGTAGALTASATWPAAVALCATLAGVWIGQSIRDRIDAETFRTCFFAGLLALGLFVLWRAI